MSPTERRAGPRGKWSGMRRNMAATGEMAEEHVKEMVTSQKRWLAKVFKRSIS